MILWLSLLTLSKAESGKGPWGRKWHALWSLHPGMRPPANFRLNQHQNRVSYHIFSKFCLKFESMVTKTEGRLECVNSCRIRKRKRLLEHFASGQTVPRWQIFPEKHLNVWNIPPETWSQAAVVLILGNPCKVLLVLMVERRDTVWYCESIDVDDQEEEEEKVVCGHNNGCFLLLGGAACASPPPPPSLPSLWIIFP